MNLLKIKLTDFKGYKNKEIDFYSKTFVEGRNASGKSTIMDAHLWLFANMDSKLKSNPDIRPSDGHECIPRVEEEWEINGSIVTIVKMQKKKVGKPDANGVSKITLSNTYEINSVQKTERDFKKDLTNLGFDFDIFLLASHISAFMQNKTDDMRKILFGMTKSKTDLEIAQMTKGCADVVALLEKYKTDEIEAMQKASRKKAAEQLEAIPNQIIGKEGAKADVNVTLLEAKKAEINQQIAEIEKRLSDSAESVREADKIASEIRKLKDDLNALSDREFAKIVEDRRKIDTKARELNRKKQVILDDLQQAELELKKVERDTERHSIELKQAQEDYTHYTNLEFDETEIRKIESEQFDETALTCPTCGQAFPDEKANKIRDDFEKGKIARLNEQERLKNEFTVRNDKKIEEITESGNKASKALQMDKQKKSDLEGSIDNFKEIIVSINEEIRRLDEELSKIPQSIDLSGNGEYIKIQNQIKEKESKLSAMRKSDYKQSKESELKEKRAELLSVESELAKAENNIRIDSQIAELKKKQRDYAQAKADAERILDQLDTVSRQKNEILQSEVNSWFRIVRVKLFKYLKNGEYDQCCIFEVLNENTGIWYEIGKSANTALEIAGKLDIISGLQKFYGKIYPVFLDGAESLDSDSMRRIQTDYQTVFLRVTDGELEVKELL